MWTLESSFSQQANKAISCSICWENTSGIGHEANSRRATGDMRHVDRSIVEAARGAAAHANKPQARRLARGAAAVGAAVGVGDNDEDLASVDGRLQEEERTLHGT